MMTAAAPLPRACATPMLGAPSRRRCPARRRAMPSRAPRRAPREGESRGGARDDVLSKVVDAAINNKVLYEGLMKPMARRTLINTAEKNGAWPGATSPRGSRRIPARSTSTPSRTTRRARRARPFHAYARARRCWLAAVEAEPATYSMALRVYPKGANHRRKSRRRACATRTRTRAARSVRRAALAAPSSVRPPRDQSTWYISRRVRPNSRMIGIG